MHSSSVRIRTFLCVIVQIECTNYRECILYNFDYQSLIISGTSIEYIVGVKYWIMAQSSNSEFRNEKKQNLYIVGGCAVILAGLSASLLHYVKELASQSIVELPIVPDLGGLSASEFVSGSDILIFFLVLTLTTFIPVAARFPLILQNADFRRSAKFSGKNISRSSLGVVPLLLIGGLIYGLQLEVPALKEKSSHHSPCITKTETAAYFDNQDLMSCYPYTPTCKKS